MKVIFILSLLYVAVVAFLARKKLKELHPRRFFLDTWKEVDARAAQARAMRAAIANATVPVEAAPLPTPTATPTSTESSPSAPETYREPASVPVNSVVGRYDYRPIVAYISLAVVLTLQEYFGDRATFMKLRDRGWLIEWGLSSNGIPAHKITLTQPLKWLSSERWGELYALCWWVVTRAGGYILVRTIVLLAWRQSPKRYGLSTKGFIDHAWIYALFFGIVLVAVVLVSQTQDFVSYYPFYAYANRSWKDFLYWETMYAFQFFALEFFFRGYLIFSSEESLGSGVVMAMVVPYCMIHFGKPVLETFAAILAGTVLGTLALKTRSIWSGFLIHVTVALSMDFTALSQKGGLPGGIKLPPSWNF